MALTDDEIIAALSEHGSQRGAARALGVHRRTIERRLAGLARKGYSPQHDMTHAVPDGFLVKGVSTYYNREGQPTGQWVKSAQDPERQRELIEQAVQAMVVDLPQLAPRKAEGALWLKKLMACYPIGDAHIGMLSWAEETGEDWDLAIAERVQCGAIAALVEGAPAAAEAVIINLGDWFHYDSMEPVTARSGHVLDADGRYAKMIGVGIKVMRQCIESALVKHKRVRVINVIGNHDDTGAIWLSAALAHVYEREPRVTVDTSPAPFTYFRHGRVLVGCHHGHSCKPDKLPGVMAADRAKDWGDTQYRYWWLGHVHHQSVREYPGVTVETFGTLAAKDAYATAGGWRSRRDMKCIVLHEEHGEVARHTISPDMLRAA
ncbi:helix-turn-helix domain-containing protein [Lysobacter enzymogenes]|uniref:helix-turn-helix domain-containing protein n=1 Tax=Lysobacter enzymogenes TaxID=69 RepID=UPI001A964DA3|nr:helix-turn-helix domain-containing protein [Lysobacter enzymogenes]QQP96531.1 hypothetical protein JHW38_00285 [Lysobacter enzymogenes]